MVKVVLVCCCFNGFHEEDVGTGSLNIGCDLCCTEADAAECSLLLIAGHVAWYLLCVSKCWWECGDLFGQCTPF
jgi:hypothetical protein